MRTVLGGAVAALLLLVAAPALAEDTGGPTAEQKALAASLHPGHGRIDLAAADAELELGEQYDFLNADEAKRVLIEGWGNPPDQVEGVLGMVFPHGRTFLDDGVWGAVITYEETFYVSDKEASKADYDKLLSEMQSGEDENNAKRKKGGYLPIHLVGWAEPPTYERARHNLIWARDIRFGDGASDALNYDVRHLGRRGVLSLNIIAGMDQLGEVREAAHGLAATAEFKPGARYADHAASDKAAGYGLVGLVAAGAGVVVAKKAGLIAILALVAKKGFVIVAAALAAIANWFRKRFGRKPAATGTVEGQPAAPAEPTVEE